MDRNAPNITNPIVFFISRFFVLGGMALVFMYTFALLGLFLSYLLFGINVFTDPTWLNDLSNPDVIKTLQLSQTLSSLGAFMIPALYFPKSIGLQPMTFLRAEGNIKPKYILAGLLLLVLSSPFISWLVYANQQVTLPSSFSAWEAKLKAAEETAARLTKAFTTADSFGGLWLNLVVVALVPAVCEEFLFRGALMRFIMLCFRNRHFAVILSAVLFSAVHGQFYGFIPRMVLGILLGYIALGSSSLWPSVIVHFVNNAIATIGMYYQWDTNGPEIFKTEYVFPVYVNVLSALATAALVYWFIAAWKKRVFPNGE